MCRRRENLGGTRRPARVGGTYQSAARADQIIDDHGYLATHVPGQQFPAHDATAAEFLHVGTADILPRQPLERLAELFRPLGAAGVGGDGHHRIATQQW